MYKINNLFDNQNIRITDEMGIYSIAEYRKDISVEPMTAESAYFASKMDVRKRQLICELDGKTGVTVQAGAMQWFVGATNATTGLKGAGDFVGKVIRGSVTRESAIKPEYVGKGTLVLEPTYKHLILLDADDWEGDVVLDDGLFLACDSSLQQKAIMRTHISSAVAGGEGLFNLALSGSGVFCIEADCPKEELVEIVLDNDVVKIDGNYAVAWSASLEFTVERSGKTLIGSAASGEGLVNVYRGTGRLLMMPVRGRSMHVAQAARTVQQATTKRQLPLL